VDAELVNSALEQISAIKEPEFRIACVRAVNDWAREVYEESNGRFIMLFPVPCQTPQEAVAELMRLAESGLPTGVIFDWVAHSNQFKRISEERAFFFISLTRVKILQ
jgi:predicted TIM-barrel fold metal-dependent hydrolase